MFLLIPYLFLAKVHLMSHVFLLEILIHHISLLIVLHTFSHFYPTVSLILHHFLLEISHFPNVQCHILPKILLYFLIENNLINYPLLPCIHIMHPILVVSRYSQTFHLFLERHSQMLQPILLKIT